MAKTPNPLYAHGPDGPDLIVLAGDWHGNIPWALFAITAAHDQGAKVIVHLGDFGLWRNDPGTIDYLSRVHRRLLQLGMVLIWTDGNHEDHDRLDAWPIDNATGMRKITNTIWHLPRGFRWRWHGKVWMALGGAHSVDRLQRSPGRSWWPREFLSAEEVEYAQRDDPEFGSKVDVMVCHDAPAKADVPVLRGPSDWPIQDLAMSARHRELIGEVVEAVRPGVLYHGHYHCRWSGEIKRDDGGMTRVIGLAEDTTHLGENLLLLDLTC